MPTDSLGDSADDMCFPDRTMASKLLIRTQGWLRPSTVNLAFSCAIHRQVFQLVDRKSGPNSVVIWSIFTEINEKV